MAWSTGNGSGCATGVGWAAAGVFGPFLPEAAAPGDGPGSSSNAGNGVGSEFPLAGPAALGCFFASSALSVGDPEFVPGSDVLDCGCDPPLGAAGGSWPVPGANNWGPAALFWSGGRSDGLESPGSDCPAGALGSINAGGPAGTGEAAADDGALPVGVLAAAGSGLAVFSSADALACFTSPACLPPGGDVAAVLLELPAGAGRLASFKSPNGSLADGEPLLPGDPAGNSAVLIGFGPASGFGLLGAGNVDAVAGAGSNLDAGVDCGSD